MHNVRARCYVSVRQLILSCSEVTAVVGVSCPAINKGEDVGSTDLHYVAASSKPTIASILRSTGASIASAAVAGVGLVGCAVCRTLHLDNQEFCIILRLYRLTEQCGSFSIKVIITLKKHF